MRINSIDDLPENLRAQARKKLEVSNNITLRTPNVECTLRDESLEKKKSKGLDTPCSIHFHHIRQRLPDRDGISVKAAIDGLVRGRLLQDDKEQIVKEITHTREKCKKGEEKTIIEIWEV